jgi:hypothetical protein
VVARFTAAGADLRRIAGRAHQLADAATAAAAAQQALDSTAAAVRDAGVSVSHGADALAAIAGQLAVDAAILRDTALALQAVNPQHLADRLVSLDRRVFAMLLLVGVAAASALIALVVVLAR